MDKRDDPRSTDELAQILWNYHHMNQQLEKADCILVMGSNDVRVAEWAVQLYKLGWAPLMVFSGHKGNLTHDWETSEATVFAEAARVMGVPESVLMVEAESTNTGENIIFTQQLLAEHAIYPKRIILVHKPYMERRAFATAIKQWSEIDYVVTSPNIPYNEYPNATIPKDIVINQMVADMQRIIIYPALGFQTRQHIPRAVHEAYDELIRRGFTKRLVQTESV